MIGRERDKTAPGDRGSQMSRADREVRRGRRLVGGRRKTSGGGPILENHGTVGYRSREDPPTGIRERRMPRSMVSVKITEDDRIGVVDKIKKRVEVRRVARWA